jgi:hypothetical protein
MSRKRTKGIRDISHCSLTQIRAARLARHVSKSCKNVCIYEQYWCINNWHH